MKSILLAFTLLTFPITSFAGPGLMMGWSTTSMTRDACNDRATQLLGSYFEPKAVRITKQGNIFAETDSVSFIVICVPTLNTALFAVAASSREIANDLSHRFKREF